MLCVSPKSNDISWGVTFPRIHVTGSRLPCFENLSRIHHPRPLWSPYSSLAARAIRVVMSGFVAFTPEQIAAAPQLAPSFEMTLRAAGISEEVITGFRVHKIKSAAIFAAMDTTAEELKDTVREAFGVDTAKYGLPHKGGVGQHSQRLVGCEGEPRSLNEGGRSGSSTWAAHPISHGRLGVHVGPVQKKYGMNIHDAKLPAQSYYESFEERLHNGVIESETLAHVVSLEEERKQIASKPEPSTQMGMHLDAANKEKVHLPHADGS